MSYLRLNRRGEHRSFHVFGRSAVLKPIVTKGAFGIRTLVCCVCVVVAADAVASNAGAAEPPGSPEETKMWGSSRIARIGAEKAPWSEVVGRKVTAEGIAWKEDKGYGEERIILDGESVFIDAATPWNEDALGTLIRVEGVLQKARIQARGPTEQGIEKAADMYIIRQAKWVEIKKVRRPWLEVQPD